MQGPTEVDSHSQADMGLSDKDIEDMAAAWSITMGLVQKAILKAGGYTWSLIQNQAYSNAMPNLISNVTCAAALKAACPATRQPDAPFQTFPRCLGSSQGRQERSSS